MTTSISDGAGYVKQLKSFDQMEIELLVHFVRRRKCDPRTLEIYTKFVKEFRKKLEVKVEMYFQWAMRQHREEIRELGLTDDEFNERVRTFQTEAKRVRDSEYAVKAKARAST